MQVEDFRRWLQQRGYSTKRVSAQLAALERLETKLSALGNRHSDIDAAYDEDQFDQLRGSIKEMRSDYLSGGDRYHLLFPSVEDAVNHITNSLVYLAQYGHFRSGKALLELDPAETYWVVGASFGGKEDQVERFLREGIWEIRTPKEAEAKDVRSMKIGDRIAIKATFVQKLNLPFDSRGQRVSVMRIKARGTIIGNSGSGERISVSWERAFEPRDWYFYTVRTTIWRLRPGGELSDRLIAFAFYDDSQDWSWFRNHSSWSATLGDDAGMRPRRFWMEKTIVSGRADRQSGQHALGLALWSPQRSRDGRNIYANMLEVSPGDVVFHLTDNSSVSSVSTVNGGADSSFIGVQGTEWGGQPGYRIALMDHQELNPPLGRVSFFGTEPFATELRELAESGARGLFYNSRLELNQGAYLTEVTPTLLSILNRAYEALAGRSLPHIPPSVRVETTEEEPVTPYTLDDALQSLFLEKTTAEAILQLWSAKKNIILQGPPGVGKSFAAQKLAFALMGTEARNRLGYVQFHQSYSYEDFVEGFRPTATGFELRPGKFVEFCRQAEADPNHTFVFVIDEINRGNLSKILGELMVLIESDKRDPSWAMSLSSGKVPFYVPPNVYIMGLMNTADRSLAVVDYALRRRFAFVDIGSSIGISKFRDQLAGAGISERIIAILVDRLGALNNEIVGDVGNLGPGFAIGHSFFCSRPLATESDAAWYIRIISTEIMPLLKEYWYDAPPKVARWRDQLLASI
jgi:hypothetical protein